jgi:hypothetical protein
MIDNTLSANSFSLFCVAGRIIKAFFSSVRFLSSSWEITGETRATHK